MGKAQQRLIALVEAWLLLQSLFISLAGAQLNPYYYDRTCPRLQFIVKQQVISAIRNETRIAASLLRLHFHDCFVQGCDGSILLDGAGTEKLGLANRNSVRGFEVIDSIKAAVENACPNVVSCADIVALAARMSVSLRGGPLWILPLGRRDSLSPNFGLTPNLPSPNANISNLVSKFANQNLTIENMVALSGGHTIGEARCNSLVVRLYNFSNTGAPDPSIDKSLLASLQRRCPLGGDGNVTNNMDMQTPTIFDNFYFQNLLLSKGLFSTDQLLYTATSETTSLVKQYAYDPGKFFAAFAKSMIKMGNLNPLVGSAGQIRKNCRVANPSGSNYRGEDEDEAEDEDEYGAISDAKADSDSKSVRDLRHLVEQACKQCTKLVARIVKIVTTKFMNREVVQPLALVKSLGTPTRSSK